jgi:hypothetical protein
MSLRSPFVHRSRPSLAVMRKSGGLAISALAVIASLSATPNKAKVHGFDLSGTVIGMDQSRKTLIVQTPFGKQTKLTWTAATTIVGSPLAVGQTVTLRYLDKDGKHIVTSIRVGRGDKTPTALAVPSPTAKPASSTSRR